MALAVWLVALPACSLADAALSALFEPRASISLEVPEAVATAQVFDCVRAGVAARPGRRGWVNTEVTRLDRTRGVIETGDYPGDNVIGLRTRTELSARPRKLVMRIRGGGPYFADIGIDAAALDLQARLRDCLALPPRTTAM